jgi:ribosome modulation factor
LRRDRAGRDRLERRHSEGRKAAQAYTRMQAQCPMHVRDCKRPDAI